MKILILGASNSQLNLIKKAQAKGHTVIVSDYYKNSPGKKYADFSEMVSTFDIEGNIKIGEKYNIDGVVTIGTDQPVYTAVRVAEELKLPNFISAETALAVTNKKIMKGILKQNNIPTVDFQLIKEGFSHRLLSKMKFPVVIKPIDSQGQRGVFKLQTINEVEKFLPDSLGFSREEEIIVEEFYESDEITVSGWVDCGITHLLSVTDRISLTNGPHIGICTSHKFPSKYLADKFAQIKKNSEQIVQAFGIYQGPIYFQMFVGNEGIKVNEIACRVGGAYEDELLNNLTGVDLLGMLVDYSLGHELDLSHLKNYNLLDITQKASVQLVFASEGLIQSLGDLSEIKKTPGLVLAGYNLQPGQKIAKIINATQRVGYFVVVADNEDQLRKRVCRTFEKFTIYDKHGNNLIISW